MYPYPRSRFSLFAKWTAHTTGHPFAVVLATLTIGIWLISGPFRTRRTATVPRCTSSSTSWSGLSRERTTLLLDLEELTEADLERLRARYESLGREARKDLLRGLMDTDTPAVPGEARQGEVSV